MALSLLPGLGGNGFMVQDPKDLRVVPDKAMKYRGHALADLRISQDRARNSKERRRRSWRENRI